MLRGVPDSPSINCPPGIALFDLDGTLIAWDCQLLFLHFVVRREPWRRVFLLVFLAFLPLAGVLGSGGMKRVFHSYLWRIEPVTLARYAREFAASLMPSIYPELRDMLENHCKQGHFLILASASPEFYVLEIGRALGFDLMLGTPTEFGAFFPDMENHKGAAKVERLKRVLPAEYFQNGKLQRCVGYTDSTADLPMLELCQAAVVVNPSHKLEAVAERCGWEILRPARPWKSRVGYAIRAIALLVGW